MTARQLRFVWILYALPAAPAHLHAQIDLGTAFTYQGRLSDSGSPANGEYDFEFKLYDDMGFQMGSTITVEDKQVTNGLFTEKLDFGEGIFNGDARLIEIGVRPSAETGAYTTLAPRQELTPSPYALARPGLWTQQNYVSTNIIGGYFRNLVTAGVDGATISGGGEYDFQNRVTDDFGTVGGGRGNRAGNNSGSTSDAKGTTIGGGLENIANASYSTIGGGRSNQSNAPDCTIGGGYSNFVTDAYCTIAGGLGNQAGDYSGTIVDAASATVGGGQENLASGAYSVIPGGYYNVAAGAHSFAAGLRAVANHQGAFVWADSADVEFSSTAADQFIIRAAGNVGIGKNNPAQPLDVAGSVQMTGFKMTTGAAANKVLTSDTSGVGTWQDPAGNISGTGFFEQVPRFTDSKTLANSIITATDTAIGIGETMPSYRLDITGTPSRDAIVYLDANWNPELFFDAGGGDADSKIHFLKTGTEYWSIVYDGSEDDLNFNRVGTGTILNLTGASSGRVGIKTTSPAGTLDVNGTIYQRGGLLHADYVFEPGYELESIEEHAKLMWSEKHLPGMPNIRRDADGNEVVEVGSHRRGIVEELEKAHIYIEQLHKRIRGLEVTRESAGQTSDQEKEIAALRRQNADLTERLKTLEKLVGQLVCQQRGHLQ